MKEAQKFLEALGKDVGIAGLIFDEQNTCTLSFDEIVIVFEYVENKKLFYMSSLVTNIPSANDKLLVYDFLLSQNSFYKGTAGGVFGIEESLNAITYTTVYHVDNSREESLARFIELAAGHVNTVDAMNKALEELVKSGTKQADLNVNDNDLLFMQTAIRI